MSEGIELPKLKYLQANAIRELRDALKRVAELEKEKAAALGLVEGHARIIAALESQQAADREELRVTKRALEMLCNATSHPWTVEEWIQESRQNFVADGGRR